MKKIIDFISNISNDRVMSMMVLFASLSLTSLNLGYDKTIMLLLVMILVELIQIGKKIK